MPTLQDVARRAGVSTATVSKVLSNTPYFTAQTREKVLRAVEELGYVPNLAARALAAGKTGIIAVVFPYVYDMIFTDPLVLHILEGIEAECSRRRYNMLLSTPRVSRHSADENYQRLILSGYMDGVIALDSVPFASVIEPIRKKGIPTINIGYHPHDHVILSDDYSGGLQLMQHVIALGHRNIGIIAVPLELHFSIHHRLAGLREGAALAGLDFDALPCANGDFSTSSGAACVARLLQQHPDLTAIICLNDRMAMGAIQRAHQIGRAVPHSLTVVGYDDIPMAAAFAPPLTTIDIHAPMLGQQAAHMLFDLLDGKTPESVKLPVDLVIRQSSSEPISGS